MYGNKVGDMVWMDLSVPNAEQVKGFYQKVIGWQSEAVVMSDNDEKYNDFTMTSAKVEGELAPEESSQDFVTESPVTENFVTGICHARGSNANMPSAWLPYFLVADIDVAVATVKSAGGDLVTEIKSMGDNRYVVIKDPAGAMCGLFQ